MLDISNCSYIQNTLCNRTYEQCVSFFFIFLLSLGEEWWVNQNCVSMSLHSKFCWCEYSFLFLYYLFIFSSTENADKGRQRLNFVNEAANKISDTRLSCVNPQFKMYFLDYGYKYENDIMALIDFTIIVVNVSITQYQKCATTHQMRYYTVFLHFQCNFITS